MHFQDKRTKMMTEAALIAAVYVALVLLFKPISFGAIQFRIAEALCILPFFSLSAVPGIALGCLLGNFFSGAAMPDVVFGTFATLIAAIGSYQLRNVSKWLVCVPPILANAIIIPFVLQYAYGVTDAYYFLFATVGAGEVLAVGVLGNILLLALESRKDSIFRQNVA
jgi:citrulline cluster-linked protein